MIINIIRWALAGFAGALFLLLAGFNFWCWFAQIRKPDAPHVSIVPIFGGIIGCIAILLAPVAVLLHRLYFAWIPLLLDVGCVWNIVGATWSWWKWKRERNR